MLTEQQCYQLLKGLMQHPLPTICVNEVAVAIVRAMHDNGTTLHPDLEEAVTISGQAPLAIELIDDALQCLRSQSDKVSTTEVSAHRKEL
jgi:hypothetical protein